MKDALESLGNEVEEEDDDPFVDCKKIRILPENNDCIVVFNFS